MTPARMNDLARKAADDQAIEWLARLRATDVTDVEKADFAQWLASDVYHKIAFDEALDLWEHVGERLAHSDEEHLPRQRWYPIAIAASLMVLALGMFLFDSSSSVDYVTGIGEQRRVALDDSSSMHLNTSTVIDVRYSEDSRTIGLSTGEAYFQVAKDRDRPFEVHTPHGVVRAIGTAFVVHAKPGLTQVVVIEGIVEVSARGGRLQLEQGDSAAASADSLQLVDVTTDLALGWTTGELVYDHMRLEEVIADLNRYFPARMALNDRNPDRPLKEMRISTLMHLADQEAVLDGLSATFDLKWSRVNDNLILISTDG
jgi:transmembrane sensor